MGRKIVIPKYLKLDLNYSKLSRKIKITSF